MHKVEAPPLVRQREHRCGRPRTDRPAPVASSPDHQSLLSIQTLGLLPVDHHALPAQQDMQASITEPAALLRQLAQLLPNIGIVTTLRPVAHDLPIGPCDTARPPLAHPMASLWVCYRFPLDGVWRHFVVRRSCSATWSSIVSESNRFSFAFSSSSERSRFSSDTSRPPYLAFQL